MTSADFYKIRKINFDVFNDDRTKIIHFPDNKSQEYITPEYFNKNYEELCNIVISIKKYIDMLNCSILENISKIDKIKNETDEESFFKHLIFENYDEIEHKLHKLYEQNIEHYKNVINDYENMINVLKNTIPNFDNFFNMYYIKTQL